MPLISGQKMACEPCIRGHRSTKCNHAEERLMVPVRRPGRPLSSCPHPASRPCSCAAVTAAIPRKQRCHCGTAAAAATTTTTTTTTTTPTTPSSENRSDHDESVGTDVTPPSPASRKGGGYGGRVQKQVAKDGSRRKQSVDATTLDRMDPSQLNVMRPYESRQNGIPSANTSDGAHPTHGMPPHSTLSLAPGDSKLIPQPAMYPYLQQPLPPPMMQSQSSGPMANGHTKPEMHESTQVVVPLKAGSCCGGTRTDSDDSNTAQTANGSSSSSQEKDTTNRSCCSSVVEPSGSNTTIHAPPMGGHSSAPAHPPNSVMMPPFQVPVAMPNAMYPYFAQPTIFTYPPNYGSYMSPLQPDQWRQMMTVLNLGQGPPPNAYGVPMPVHYAPTAELNAAGGVTHQCKCGESCQCIGCAAHPYNEATQNYVRSAWDTVAEDGPGAQEDVNDGHTPAGVATNGNLDIKPTGADGTNSITNTADITIHSPSPMTHSASDAASIEGEEQTLSANDFFFVSYPFGDSCAGDTASCPCGDDCQCIGCAIHNNPGPEE